MYKLLASTLLAAVAVLFNPLVRAQQATLLATETPQSMLAAQIRMQGFTCDEPLGAVRDFQTLPPRPRRFGPQVQRRHLPDRSRARHGGEIRTTPVTIESKA
jgi:hypothetical protein